MTLEKPEGTLVERHVWPLLAECVREFRVTIVGLVPQSDGAG
jgi:hypothetical protein